MKLIPCTFEDHAEAILSIFNDAILNSTALYDYQPRTLETMRAWFALPQARSMVAWTLDCSRSSAMVAAPSTAPKRPRPPAVPCSMST